MLFLSLIFVSCSGSSGGGSDPAPQEEEDTGGTTGGTSTGGASGGTTTGGTSGGTTTGGTSGGTTTGGTSGGTTTGGTSGGTTTGGTSGGTTGGTNACGIPNSQIQNIISLFTNLSDWASFSGFGEAIPENLSEPSKASVTQIDSLGWRFVGNINGPLGDPLLIFTATLEIRTDGCVYSFDNKTSIISSTANRLSIRTLFSDGSVEESYVISVPYQFDYNVRSINTSGETEASRKFDLQRR
jgi:hypothetical protein